MANILKSTAAKLIKKIQSLHCVKTEAKYRKAQDRMVKAHEDG